MTTKTPFSAANLFSTGSSTSWGEYLSAGMVTLGIVVALLI